MQSWSKMNLGYVWHTGKQKNPARNITCLTDETDPHVIFIPIPNPSLSLRFTKMATSGRRNGTPSWRRPAAAELVVLLARFEAELGILDGRCGRSHQATRGRGSRMPSRWRSAAAALMAGSGRRSKDWQVQPPRVCLGADCAARSNELETVHLNRGHGGEHVPIFLTYLIVNNPAP